MKKKIGIIGQFPPPMHGLSKALDTLYNSYLSEEFDFTKIDITNNKKFISNLFKILFSKLDLYYLTISQSKLGNIRDLVIIKLIQLKRRKIVIHLHGGGFRYILDNKFNKIHKYINYRILSKVDDAIVLGDSLRYIFKNIISEDRIHIVKNCVDDEFFMSDEEFITKIELVNSKEILNILYLSNFIEEKGYKDVLKLASIARKNNCDRFRFIFAGKFFSKEDESEFLDFIENNNLKSIVEYRGVVGGLKKNKILKESDIFILLTRYLNEGQPISILEAMANGLVPICTDHAGIPDIVENNKNGIVIKSSEIDIEYIFRKLLLMDNEEIYNVAVNNRAKILRNHTENQYLKEIYNIMSKY